MSSFRENSYPHGSRLHYYAALYFLAFCVSLASAGMYAGEPCTMGSQPGICHHASGCPKLEAAVKAGRISTDDIVHCGYGKYEEIICCPTEGNIKVTPRDPPRDPIWSVYPINDGSVGIPTPTPTPTPPPTPTPTPKPSNKDRPAVIACRQIDEGLDPAYGENIINGAPVELREFPHMAAIGYSSIGANEGSYDYRCGGTLIDKKFVLTAAHCVNSKESPPVVVLMGLVNINDPDERRAATEIRVRAIHIHPDYFSGSTYHDVAVLELEKEVTYSDFVYPTCLYTDLRDPPSNLELYVTGWGRYSTKNGNKSDILLKAKLQAVPQTLCNARIAENGPNRRIRDGVLESQMCAQDPGLVVDACQGDSGGPLNVVMNSTVRQYRIAGIISAGFSCGTRTPGLYTRVAAFLDFIESKVWPHLI